MPLRYLKHILLVLAGFMTVAASTGSGSDNTAFRAVLGEIIGDRTPSDQRKPEFALLMLDVDNDGDLDFVVGDETGKPSVVWYRNEGDEFSRYVVHDLRLSPGTGAAHHDIDGDGDQDLVIGGNNTTNEIWWWENPYPDYHPTRMWSMRLVKNTGPADHEHLSFQDADEDGVPELLFWNRDGLHLAEIPTGKTFAERWKRLANAWQIRRIYPQTP